MWFGKENKDKEIMKLNKKAILLLLTFLLGFCRFMPAQNPLKIYCLDVNQGSSTLIVSPTNKKILIDAGEVIGNYGDSIYRFIKNLGITHLNYTLATHYHSDHIGGFPVVICSLSRGANNDSILNYCYDRGDIDTFPSVPYRNYRNIISSRRRTIALGETINLGGGAILVCVVKNGKLVNNDSVIPLPPSSENENYRSIGLVLKYGQFELWVGGDLTGIDGERDVESKVAAVVKNVDVYVANHHGSSTSSTQIFLDSLRPKVAIFSQGTHPNNYGHPHQATIDRLVARNCYLYQMNTNPNSGTFRIPDSGKILNTSASITVNNWEYVVNGDTYPIDGVRRDGEVLRILFPKDTITEGTLVTPRARIRNLGNTIETFPIRFKISSGYNRTKIITNLPPNDSLDVQFDTTWLAQRGNYQVSCSTEVPRDIFSGNDKKTATLTVAFYDAELKQIVNPSANDTLFTTETLKPKVIIKDNSEYSNQSAVKVFFQINSHTTYIDSILSILSPGQTDTIVFRPIPLFNLSTGVHRCSSWVRRNNDLVLVNNQKALSFVVKTTTFSLWESLPSIPLGTKAVKDGGCLVADSVNIYALKGNNTLEFYSYNPITRIWQPKTSLIYSPYNNKNVRKGAAMTYGEDAFGNKVLYVLKGNRTNEIWQYYINGDSWRLLTNVSGEGFKAGSGIAYAVITNGSKYVYCLKGSNKDYEFLGFNIASNQWTILQKAPAGRKMKRFNDGSCLVAVRETIFALKGGARYNEFYCYDIRTDSWTELESLPEIHPAIGREKRVKSGGAITFDKVSNRLYVFKGGRTQEFWCYDINNRIWIPLETIPKGISANKGVIQSGGSLTALAGRIYALKGNNTYEFWRYNPTAEMLNLRLVDEEIKADILKPKDVVNVPPSIQNNFYLKSDSKKIEMVLYDLSGRLIRKKTILNSNNRVFSGKRSDLAMLLSRELIGSTDIPKGIYFAVIKNNKSQSFTRIVKVN